MAALTEHQRRAVLEAVLRVIDTKYMGPAVETPALRAAHEAAVVGSDDAEAFDAAINAMLKDLGVSHTGFFHESAPRVAGRIALAATFTKAETADGERWMFQDVHPGGAAAVAGVRPGDVLLSVAGKELAPPHATPFAFGERYEVVLRRPDGSTSTPTLDIPRPTDKRRPLIVPGQVVTARRLGDGTGYMRVTMFPGVLGMDVARDMSRAVSDLATERLVVDLRGNSGGGIGCLRLMSLLCTDRRGVGYSVGKATSAKEYRKEDLPVLDRIPSSKWGVLPLIPRFALAGRSVAVFTEALGAQTHHGRVAILVNEHSASAAEMVAAFAQENRLATLVGTKTAGRLVAASAFKVGHGYRVALPVAEYYTWAGTRLEGVGVEPDVAVTTKPAALREGADPARDAATRHLTAT
jgi:C-terminal processing protease CtpA/Prc